jgi:outer membrane protein assembly factor BamB
MEAGELDGFNVYELEDMSSRVSSTDVVVTLRLLRDLRTQAFQIGEGGSILGSCVAHSGIVYFGCMDRYFYALDLLTGKERWRMQTGDSNAGSPGFDENRIYFPSYDQHVYCVDLNGKVLWRFRTMDKVFSTPLVHKDRVFFGSGDHNLYALNARTGHLLWKFRTQAAIASNPLVHKDVLYFGSFDQNMYALDLDGNMRWKFTAKGAANSPRVYKDMLFFGSSDHNLYCLDLEGKLRWKFTAQGPMTQRPPTIHEDMVYFGCRDNNLYAIGIDGKLKWRFRCRDMIKAYPVIDPEKQKLYFGSDDFNVYALDSNNGKLVWKHKTDGPVMAVPVLAGGLVLVGSWDCVFYALDSETGKPRWKFKTSSSFQSPIEPEIRIETEPFRFISAGPATEEAKEGAVEETERPTYGVMKTSYVSEEEVIDIGSLATISRSYGGGGDKKYR